MGLAGCAQRYCSGSISSFLLTWEIDFFIRLSHITEQYLCLLCVHHIIFIQDFGCIGEALVGRGER